VGWVFVTHTITARDVPELRADMVADSVDFTKKFPGHHPWYPSHEAADLFWISKEMRQLGEVAAGSLPEYTVRVEDMPSEHGILVWEDTADGMAGVAWKTVGNVVVLTVLVPKAKAIEMVARATKDPKTVEKLRHSTVRSGLWSEMEIPIRIGSVVKPGDLRLETTYKLDEDARWAELAPRMAVTMWLLMGQTLAAREIVRPSKAGMKRLARLNPNLLTETRYVTLRHAKMPQTEGDGVGVQYSVRWFVKGHWRNQPFGPGLSQVRPIWIAPHIKGPEGAPILDPSKLVNVLRR
jgi:hypothetical protein